MVSRRFRNRVNLSGASPDAVAARIETLEESDALLYREDLAQIAQQADGYDKKIRLAAISKLEHIPALTPLLEDTPDIAEAAAASIARLITRNPTGNHESLMASSSVKLAFIRASRTPDPVQEFINQLDVDQLVDLAQSAAFPGVRREAANRVHDEEPLTVIANNAKNRDKSVFRLARTRLDRIRSARRSIEEAEQRASSIADRLAELSKMPVDRSFVPRLKIIEQEWQECLSVHSHSLQSVPQLASNFPALSSADTYAASLQRAESRIEKETTCKDQPSEQEQAQKASSALEKTPPQIGALPAGTNLEKLRSILSEPTPEFSKPKSIDEHRSLWQEAHQLERIERRLQSSLRELQSANNPEQAEWVQKIQFRLEAHETYRKAIDGLREELLESYKNKFEQITEQIQLGGLGSANDLRRSCGDILRALPEIQARKLWKQLHETDANIQQLRDWQSYAATPKREALCDRMAQIAERPLAINEQMDQIRALREEWKTLGPLTGGHDHELRRRFERLAEASFSHCRVHFQEQSEQRKRNLEARQRLCSDLELFIEQKDWSNPDFKALDRILRTARAEWRAAHPVDRAKSKALQKRFDDLCDNIYTRLSAHWKGNELKARGLIVELRALLESTSSVERLTEGTSAIQARWREIGPLSHKANRKLWKEFRGLCDQVYNQRRERRDQENEAFRDKLERARQLVARLESSIEQGTSDSVSMGELTQLTEEWEGFQNTPGEAFKRLNNRWRDLARRYRQMLREGDLAQQLRLIELASSFDANLCKAEQAILDSGELPGESLLDSLSQDAKSLYGKSPLGRLDALREGLTIDQEHVQAGVVERRRMCVKLDIEADRESGPEDKALRLEIQVQRINQGSQMGRELKEEPVSIARDWCRVGPVGAQGESLNKRFFDTLKLMAD